MVDQLSQYDLEISLPVFEVSLHQLFQQLVSAVFISPDLYQTYQEMPLKSDQKFIIEISDFSCLKLMPFDPTIILP